MSELMLSFLATLQIKVAVFILLLAALLYGTKRLSSGDKYLVMTVALGILAILPLLQLAIPSYKISVDWLSIASERENEVVATIFEVGAETTAPSDQSYVVATTLPIAYLVIAVFLLLRLAIGLYRTRREIRRYHPLGHLESRAALESLARRLNVQPPELRADDTGAGPYVWGIGKPIIVVPTEFISVSADVQRTVLTHELIHIQRRDTLTCIASKILCCLYWINPAIWLLERRLKLEMEKSCDEQAASLGIGAAEYAEQLLEAIKQLHIPQRQPRYAVAMARRSSLQQRIHSLLNNPEQRGPMSKSRLILLGAGLFGAVVAIGAVTATPTPPTATSDVASTTTRSSKYTREELAMVSDILGRTNRIDKETDEVRVVKFSFGKGFVSIDGKSAQMKGISIFLGKLDREFGRVTLESVHTDAEDGYDFKIKLDNFDRKTPAPTNP